MYNPRHKVNKENPMIKKAYFAGGCFWGLEYHFRKCNGIKSVMPGYMGGTVPNPRYEEVCKGTTGHHEVVEVQYDQTIIGYKEVLMIFFELHDPTGQILGEYQEAPESVIFTSGKNEIATAQSLIEYLQEQEENIISEIKSHTEFWPAEEEHQDYYNNNKSSPPCTIRVKRFLDYPEVTIK